MAEKFDISIDRVDKIPVPLLVVGLGGTGRDVLITIKKTFAERYNLPQTVKGYAQPLPAKTAYLAIDTDQKPEDLETNEYLDITLKGLDKMLSLQDTYLTPSERTWVNRNLRHSTSGIGSGTIRQAARLALERNYSIVCDRIRSALENIASTRAGAGNDDANRLEIVVVTGIGGGTGSGIFLDMAQILRHAAEKINPSVRITAYVVMPDVSLDNVKTSPGMIPAIRHNAYAALKELDFWMRYPEHQTEYQMDYNGEVIKWGKPFDNCVLMSCSNVKGTPYKNGYEAVQNTIAENLMHYMAQEDAVTNGYTYRQYEDNLNAIVPPRKYPLNYCYRAIGAFTKRIPKKPVLYYEGTKLFATFIPPKDENGKYQPDKRMFTDGQDQVRAEKIVGIGRQLMQDFCTNRVKMPDECHIDLDDKVKVQSMANARSPQHDVWQKYRDEKANPAALKEAERYLDAAWERFENFAKSVISDPDQGPFALLQYLDSNQTLLKKMNETLSSWNAQRMKEHSDIARFEGLCRDAWGGFKNPPFLRKRAAQEEYKHALLTLYTKVINDAFLEAHCEALRKLILRIEEYIRDGLKPLCAAIEQQADEFIKTIETDDQTLVQDIYQLDTVTDTIDKKFEAENENNKLSARFLGRVADISVECVPNVDSRSSGVTFTSRMNGFQELCRSIQHELSEVFGSVNNQSLDSIVIAKAGEDVASQHKWMNDLVNNVVSSAQPMFKQANIFAAEPVAPYNYLSIPEDATELFKYIEETFQSSGPRVSPKKSFLKDHLYCLNTLDKLPLYHYADMDELARQYDADLDQESAQGMHLVCTGDPSTDFLHDWSKLPSPKPFFLFAKGGTPSEMREYENVRALVARAIACGMITVSDETETAGADVRAFPAESGKGLRTSETMMSDRNRIVEEKNPATGAPYSKAERIKHLQAYLDNAKVIQLKAINISPASIAGILGLENEPCDPFDPNIQGDENGKKQAMENHKKLCVAMVETLIYMRPDVLQVLRLQLRAFEEITAEIADASTSEDVWSKRMKYAGVGAEIFIYLDSALSVGLSGYQYRNKDEKYTIISPDLMSPDLDNIESYILKTVCYLADVSGENPARADLETMLKYEKNNVEDMSDRGTLSRDDLQTLTDAAEKLIAEMEEDQNSLERAKRMHPEMLDELKQQISMIDAIIKKAKDNIRTFGQMAKGLQ